MLLSLTLILFVFTAPVSAASAGTDTTHSSHVKKIKPQQSVTSGSVTVEGTKIDYTAKAGTIILKNREGKPTASMFYVAYTKKGVSDKSHRPVTFFWNGGPGSSTVWLHMGAFGPLRVQTADHTHTKAAPYKLLNNNYSLLDATDEVFIDAVGTGYSRVLGKDKGGVGKGSDFYGIDSDAQSFAQFIERYISQNNRWNSPKYIFGESYGTTRAALLSKILEEQDDIDLNGVVLLSCVLNFEAYSFNTGNDLPYELFLPSMAAVAWYHHKLPNRPEKLKPFLKKVEQFALGDYAAALAQGDKLDATTRSNIIERLHDFTGLDKQYISKANLRVTGLEFEKELLNKSDSTVGRLNARFAGPTMDPMSVTASYEPNDAAISSAYISTFNHYAHTVLDFGKNMMYRPFGGGRWDWKHGHRSHGQTWPGLPNVAADLANAMKYNPQLQVLVNNGYFDLGTPFYATVYSFDHMNIPPGLIKNIHMEYYHSGHMVYLHKESLKNLHDNTARFIKNTDNLK